MQRRTLIQHSLASALLLGTALAAMPAAAQGNWPTGKPITYLVPFPPGGNTDTLARVIAQPLSKALGTPVVIENKGGAGGSVGSAIAARAPADGYTILGGTISSHAINVSLYAKLDYDPVKSFTPVAMLGSGPLVLVVPASSPYKTLADVLAAHVMDAAVVDGELMYFDPAPMELIARLQNPGWYGRVGGAFQMPTPSGAQWDAMQRQGVSNSYLAWADDGAAAR